MRSGKRGKKQTQNPFERAFERVKRDIAAERMESAVARLREMERTGLFPEERLYELHEYMGQLLYWLTDLAEALPHLRLAWELPRADHAARLAALSNYLMYLHYAEGVANEELWAAHAAYAVMLGDVPQSVPFPLKDRHSRPPSPPPNPSPRSAASRYHRDTPRNACGHRRRTAVWRSSERCDP